jgi:hypothetical protein
VQGALTGKAALTCGLPSERLTSGQPNRRRSGISGKCAITRQIGFCLLNCRADATRVTDLTLVTAGLGDYGALVVVSKSLSVRESRLLSAHCGRFTYR